jgi:Flp pilus assembly protein TadB
MAKHRFGRTVASEGGTQMIDERKHSLVGLTLAVAIGIVIGSLAVAVVFAVLGAILHVVGWLLHVGVIVAVILGVWWLVIGRRRRCRPS